MPIDWIDVKSKYKLDPNNSGVKAIATKYDKELNALAAACDVIAQKAKKENDAKKKKALEETATKNHQSGLIKLRKEAEVALSKIVVVSAPTAAKSIQSNHDTSFFDGNLQKLGLKKDDPKVKEAFVMYNKAVDAVTAKANEALKEGHLGKGPKEEVTDRGAGNEIAPDGFDRGQERNPSSAE